MTNKEHKLSNPTLANSLSTEEFNQVLKDFTRAIVVYMSWKSAGLLDDKKS